MTTAPTTVLVLGGTGTTGRRVAAGLAERSVTTRTATRAPRPDQPHQIRFAWGDPATHAPAVRGVDALYLISPIGESDPESVVAPFLSLAREAGVRRVVLLGSSAVEEGEPGPGALYRLVRTGFPEWAVLRPSWFMQNFTGDHPVATDIRTDGEIVTATGSGRVAFVDAADIAAVAVRALTDPTPHQTEHLITGPEALSYDAAADLIARITGRQVRHRSVTEAELTARLAATGGVPEEFAGLLAGLDTAIRGGAEDRVTSAVREVTGREPRSFAAFVAAHREEFAAR